jgi:D-psicose/D-tagatose/L-ribulose 3-epimerase
MAGASQCGYNRLEIPLLDTWDLQPQLTGRLLKEHGLDMTGNLFLTAATDITSDDEKAVTAGERRLMTGVDTVASVGGGYLCGTIYSMLGRYDHPPTARGREQCASVLQRVADHAANSGVRLGLELCNRYETNLLNSASQALSMLEVIDRPNVYVHLDTYHMNIEETDMVRPVLACGHKLGYVHIGESHRGYLGSGQVDFDSFFRALAEIGYDGPITFESFSSSVVSPELTDALCIWRNPWTDSGDLARHARQFIDQHLYASSRTASES